MGQTQQKIDDKNEGAKEWGVAMVTGPPQDSGRPRIELQLKENQPVKTLKKL